MRNYSKYIRQNLRYYLTKTIPPRVSLVQYVFLHPSTDVLILATHNCMCKAIVVKCFLCLYLNGDLKKHLVIVC